MPERLPIVIAQVKAGDLLNKIRKKCYSLYQSKKKKKVYNNIIKSMQI